MMSAPDWSTANYDFIGETSEFPTHLASEFQLVQDNVNAVDGEVADGNLALHGSGKEIGCGLTAGSGLSCVIGTGSHWVGGRRCQIASPITVSLTAGTTSWIYLDDEETPSLYPGLQSPNPTGTWFVGTATTDSDSCTAVSITGADTVSSNAALSADVATLQADEVKTEAAVGMPTTVRLPPPARSTTGSPTWRAEGRRGTVAYWGGLDKALGDATSVDQEIDSKIADAVASLPTSTGNSTITLIDWTWTPTT